MSRDAQQNGSHNCNCYSAPTPVQASTHNRVSESNQAFSKVSNKLRQHSYKSVLPQAAINKDGKCLNVGCVCQKLDCGSDGRAPPNPLIDIVIRHTGHTDVKPIIKSEQAIPNSTSQTTCTTCLSPVYQHPHVNSVSAYQTLSACNCNDCIPVRKLHGYSSISTAHSSIFTRSQSVTTTAVGTTMTSSANRYSYTSQSFSSNSHNQSKLFSKSDSSKWEYSSSSTSCRPTMFRNRQYRSASAALDDYICSFEGKDSSISHLREKYAQEVDDLLSGGTSSFSSSASGGSATRKIIDLIRLVDESYERLAHQKHISPVNTGTGVSVCAVADALSESSRVLHTINSDKLPSPAQTEINTRRQTSSSIATDVLLQVQPYDQSHLPLLNSAGLLHAQPNRLLQTKALATEALASDLFNQSANFKDQTTYSDRDGKLGYVSNGQVHNVKNRTIPNIQMPHPPPYDLLHPKHSLDDPGVLDKNAARSLDSLVDFKMEAENPILKAFLSSHTQKSSGTIQTKQRDSVTETGNLQDNQTSRIEMSSIPVETTVHSTRQGPPSWVNELEASEASSIISGHMQKRKTQGGNKMASTPKKPTPKSVSTSHEDNKSVNKQLRFDLEASYFSPASSRGNELHIDDLSVQQQQQQPGTSILKSQDPYISRGLHPASHYDGKSSPSRLSLTTDDLIEADPAGRLGRDAKRTGPSGPRSQSADAAPRQLGQRLLAAGNESSSSSKQTANNIAGHEAANERHRKYLQDLMRDIQDTQSSIVNDSMLPSSVEVASSEGMSKKVAEPPKIETDTACGFLERIKGLLLTPPPLLRPASSTSSLGSSTDRILDGDRSWERLPPTFKPPPPNATVEEDAAAIERFLKECLHEEKEKDENRTLTGISHPGGMEALKNMLFAVQSMSREATLNADNTLEESKLGEDSGLLTPETKKLLSGKSGGANLERALDHLERLKSYADSHKYGN